jgi:hypothetical protein
MKLHKFNSTFGSRVALTKDKTGSNLPSGAANWKYVGTMDVDSTDGPRIGASSPDIISGIQKDGYFLWPASIIP